MDGFDELPDALGAATEFVQDAPGLELSDASSPGPLMRPVTRIGAGS